MRYVEDWVPDQAGNAVAGASVAIYLTGTTTEATIYSDDGVTEATNPLTTDSLGRYSFWIAAGVYDHYVSGTGITPYTKSNQQHYDLREYLSPVGSPVFDVTADPYLAAGDGVTDDSAAIQAALDAASTAKGTVVIGGGRRYFVDATILLDDDVTIEGDGTLVRDVGLTGGYLLRANEKSNIVIRGLRFEGDGTGTYEGSGTYSHIVLYGCSNVLIDGIYSLNSSSDDIYIGTRASFHSTVPKDIRVVNCHLEGAERDGVVVSCGEGIVIANNTIRDCAGVGIDVEPYDGDQYVGNVTIANNSVISNAIQEFVVGSSTLTSHALDIECDTGEEMRDFIITGNHFEVAQAAPDADEATYENIVCFLSVQGGARLTFSGNFIRSNALSTVNGEFGLVSVRHAAGIVMNGNQIVGPATNCTGHTWGTANGITVDGRLADNAERITLTGNRVTGYIKQLVRLIETNGINCDNVLVSTLASDSFGYYLDTCDGVRITGMIYGTTGAVRPKNSTGILMTGAIVSPVSARYNFYMGSADGTSTATAIGCVTSEATGAWDGTYNGLAMDNSIDGAATFTLHEAFTDTYALP